MSEGTDRSRDVFAFSGDFEVGEKLVDLVVTESSDVFVLEVRVLGGADLGMGRGVVSVGVGMGGLGWIGRHL